MSFDFNEGTDLECADCGTEIERHQYQRKVPRCDDCEADALLEEDHDVLPESWQ